MWVFCIFRTRCSLSLVPVIERCTAALSADGQVRRTHTHTRRAALGFKERCAALPAKCAREYRAAAGLLGCSHELGGATAAAAVDALLCIA